MAKISIGIDLGSECVRIVCLKNTDNVCSLSAIGMFSHKGSDTELQRFIGFVNFESKDIRINIDDPSLKIRRLDLPTMTDAEIPEAIKWGLKDIVEGDAEEFSFRHVKFDPDDVTVTNKIPMMIYAVKSSAVENLYSHTRQIGLPKPIVIEPDVSALGNIFSFSKGVLRPGYAVLVYISESSTLFAMMGKKGLIYSRPLIGCAEKNLIDQIARDCAMDMPKAEAAMKGYFAVAPTNADSLLQNTVMHFFSRIAVEIQRSIDGSATLFEQGIADKIYVCGKGAYYKGLLDYLQTQLNMPAFIFDPFEKIDTTSVDQSKLNESRAVFAVACGLAVDV